MQSTILDILGAGKPNKQTTREASGEVGVVPKKQAHLQHTTTNYQWRRVIGSGCDMF